MIGNDWNIKDFINMNCIGKVCTVQDTIGLENIGQKILDKSLLEGIQLNF